MSGGKGQVGGCQVEARDHTANDVTMTKQFWPCLEVPRATTQQQIKNGYSIIFDEKTVFSLGIARHTFHLYTKLFQRVSYFNFWPNTLSVYKPTMEGHTV